MPRTPFTPPFAYNPRPLPNEFIGLISDWMLILILFRFVLSTTVLGTRPGRLPLVLDVERITGLFCPSPWAWAWPRHQGTRIHSSENSSPCTLPKLGGKMALGPCMACRGMAGFNHQTFILLHTACEQVCTKLVTRIGASHISSKFSSGTHVNSNTVSSEPARQPQARGPQLYAQTNTSRWKEETTRTEKVDFPTAVDF